MPNLPPAPWLHEEFDYEWRQWLNEVVKQVESNSGLTLGTPKTGDGVVTEIDFTDLPTGLNVVHVTFTGLQVDGVGINSGPLIQLGDNGVPVTSGYGGGTSEEGATPGVFASPSGIPIVNGPSVLSTEIYNGAVTILKHDDTNNVWTWHGSSYNIVSVKTSQTAGEIALPGELNLVRLTTGIGITAIESGTKVNILYG